MNNSLTHYDIIEEKGGFMDVSYTLGRLIGALFGCLKRLNFTAKFFLAYSIVSNVTLYKEDFSDLVAYGSVVMGFIVASIFYYWMFLCFRGSLRWVGKQLNYGK